MTYQKTVDIRRAEDIKGLQPGQWINYDGARGRFMGIKNGCHWVAWGETAKRRFARFADAFRAA
ncbi:hypothetical protein [Rhizobium phage RHph_X2_26]|nr:hypothetical protein [Rhizobium phage RHph_X2_26]